MNSIYAVGANCSSVTYGNVAQHVRELVKNLFPKNFFTYEVISTEIAFRNIRRRVGANAKHLIAFKSKPYMVIRPVLSVPDEGYLYNIPMTANIDHVESSLDKRTLIPIIQDTDEGLGLSYKLNRDKIEYQVTVTVATLMQQIDAYKYLMNTITWNRPFTKTLPMEFMIPRGIISALAGRQHMDLNKPTYAASIFLDYINSHSRYPITYKMRNSTSKDEYFMYSTQQVLVTIEDLQISEGTRKNMADDSFELTFRVTAEFNLPGLFVLYGSQDLKESTMTKDVTTEMVVNDAISFPLYTLENLFGDEEDRQGFKKFRSSILNLDPDKKTGDDKTNFGGLLSDSIETIIKSYLINHVDINTIASISLYKNSDKLVEGVDYLVDWRTCDLITYKPDMEASYRMIMYLNMVKVNELATEMQDQISSDKPHA